MGGNHNAGASSGARRRAFKYAAELAAFSDCPPQVVANCVEETVYRFVKDPMNDSFLPMALLPDGLDEPCCEGYALSMYVSVAKAKKRWRQLFRKNSDRVLELMGDRLAEVRLEPGHGVRTAVSTSGHFGVFEFADVNFAGSSRLLPGCLTDD
jgi:hypothetical protein